MPPDCDETQFVGIGTHGAELEKTEILIVLSDPDLTIEDRALGVTLDPHGQNSEEGTQHHQSEATRHDIKQSFHDNPDVRGT